MITTVTHTCDITLYDSTLLYIIRKFIRKIHVQMFLYSTVHNKENSTSKVKITIKINPSNFLNAFECFPSGSTHKSQ